MTPKPVIRETPTHLEPKQSQSAINPKTVTAQETGSFSNAEMRIFRNGVLFTKHSDTAMKILVKASSHDLVATFENRPNDFYSTSHRKKFNTYNILGVVLHEYFLNIALLFAPYGFANEFIAMFGIRFYFLTQCKNCFPLSCSCTKFLYSF